MVKKYGYEQIRQISTYPNINKYVARNKLKSEADNIRLSLIQKEIY